MIAASLPLETWTRHDSRQPGETGDTVLEAVGDSKHYTVARGLTIKSFGIPPYSSNFPCLTQTNEIA